MAAIQWETDLEAGLAAAQKSRKPVFVDFWFDG